MAIHNKPTRLDPTEFRTATYFHDPVNGVTLEDIQQPAYWSHVARQLSPGSKIEVMAQDGSYYALLLVVTKGRAEVAVEVLFAKELDGMAVEEDDPAYIVEWKAPALKWCVIRTADNEIVADKFPHKSHAFNWIKNRKKAMAA